MGKGGRGLREGRAREVRMGVRRISGREGRLRGPSDLNKCHLKGASGLVAPAKGNARWNYQLWMDEAYRQKAEGK